jgi:hypothetical protein
MRHGDRRAEDGQGERQPAKTSGGAAVAGGIGAFILAVVVGVAKNVDDIGRGGLRYADDVGRALIRSADDVAPRIGRHGDDLPPYRLIGEETPLLIPEMPQAGRQGGRRFVSQAPNKSPGDKVVSEIAEGALDMGLDYLKEKVKEK